MKAKPTKSILSLWLAASLLLFLTAQSFAQERLDAQLIQGAEKEAKLVWWTTTNIDLSQKIVNRFERKYPFIKADLFRAGRGPLLNKILAEALAGRHAWDVISGSGEMHLPLMERRLLAPYRSSENKAYDESMRGKDDDWIAYHINTYVLGFNTRMVKNAEAPRSYEALLDSKWKGGKISLDSDAYPILYGLSRAWGRDKAISYLKRLAAQDPIVKRGNDERAQLAAAGEYPLVMAYATTIERFASMGAPLGWLPLEPIVTQVNPLELAAHAPHPNSARLFMDFALSKEGQEMIRDGLRQPARADVEVVSALSLKGYKRVVVDPDSYQNYRETVKLYQEILATR